MLWLDMGVDILKVYSFERAVGVCEGGLGRDRSSIHWLTPQVPAMTRAGPRPTQEPGTSSRFPIGVTDTEVLGPLSVSQKLWWGAG